MGAHPLAYERIASNIMKTKDRTIQDELLDKWLEYRDLATSWDAEGWGFDVDKWMLKERTELMSRANSSDLSQPSRRLDRGVP
jgi:hypothetical protein